jgi:predicted O-methyltransferase YrrM
MRLKFISRSYSNIARHTVDLFFGSRFWNDIELHQRLQAVQSSALYANTAMPNAERFRDRDALLLDAVKRSAAVGGCICEFGVWSGHTLQLMADAAPERRVHGFDSFEGLPEDWRTGYAKGTFTTPMPKFRQPNIELHKGWFDASLPAFVKRLDGPIGLAHVDCDLYSSTCTVLEHIAPHLAPGTILVFDEYFNYPGWEQHEHKALMEAVAAKRFSIRYLAFNSLNEQVMVEVLAPRGRRKRRDRPDLSRG